MLCKEVIQPQVPLGDLSPDCSLQLDCMKLESLVIANQNVAVNTFPGLVHTARHLLTKRAMLYEYSQQIILI
jgi:hypothetical protein